MTTFRMLLPVGALALVQLIAFLCYGGFHLTLRASTELLVVFCYLFFMLSLLVSSVMDGKRVQHAPSVEVAGERKADKYIVALVVTLIFAFITLPTIKLIFLSN